MFKNMSIGKQIILGFTAVIVILIVVAVYSFMGVGGIVDNASEVIEGNKLRGNMVQREVDHLNWARAVSALLTDDKVTELTVETDPHKCAFGKWYYSADKDAAIELVPQLAGPLGEIEEPHRLLHESAIKIAEAFKPADLNLSAMLEAKKVDHLNWMLAVKDVFADPTINHLAVQTDSHKCAFGQWYYSDAVKQMRRNDTAFDKILEAVEEPHKKLHESAVHINKLLEEGKRDEAMAYFNENTARYAEETLAAIDAIIAWNNKQVEGLQEAKRIMADETEPQLAKVQGLLGKVNEVAAENIMTDQEMLHAATKTKWGVSIGAVIGFVVAVILAWVLSTAIVRALTRVIEGLERGSDQVASAANQVSQSSQSMAEGASEQASSLEETSASLEEMSSMTRQNADNANQANVISKEASEAATRGREAMTRMSEGIDRIKNSSDETAKIIKTIDEIAFQTNLLALNAAVEAARAGDAGKGFAVVAEEVRNLAQRSAEAARNTADLIEEAQQNADNGVAVSQEVGGILEQITSSVEKVTQLINEVSVASKEQAQGVEQVNTAVAQMDQVTQANAANSEEAASASEELSAQAAELNDLVAALVELVGGKAARRGASSQSPGRAAPARPQQRRPQVQPRRPAPQLQHRKAGSSPPRKAVESRTVTPEEVIPLDEDDMHDF